MNMEPKPNQVEIKPPAVPMTAEPITGPKLGQVDSDDGGLGREVAETLARMQQSAKSNSAQRDAFLAREEKMRLEQAARMFLEGDPPRRNARVDPASLDRSGKWGKLEQHVLAALGKGFLFCLLGTRGCGKTQVAVEAMRAVAGKLRTVKFCTVMAFFMDVKAGYGHPDNPSEKQVFEAYRKPSLLVVDEAGQRSESEWENRLLGELFNARYNDCKDTLLISNQNVGEVEASLGPSLISRMQETGAIIECHWKSYRE
jgi:DNA replication protein DnaC